MVFGGTSIVVMSMPSSASKPAVLSSTGTCLVNIQVVAGSSSGVQSSGPTGLSAQAGEVACAAAVITLLPIGWAFILREGITASGTFYLCT